MATEHYVLGIDGGGTHTTALLARRDGHVLATGRGGPANFQDVGVDVAGASIAASIDAALAAAPGVAVPREQVAAAVAGLAGIHIQADDERFTAIVSTLLPASRIRVCTDGEVALAAATGGREGIVVVAGTGSIAFGADQTGRYLRCGGWGYVIGDEGSGYAIVRQALRAASYAADGRAPPSTLVTAFAAALGVASFDDILRPVYGPPAMTRQQIAALAPLVTECAEAGDAAALAVLGQAGEDLATLPIALARSLGLGRAPFPVACSGGVWMAGESVLASFRRHVSAACPRALIGPPLLAPAAGAALLAIHLLNGDGPTDPTALEKLGAIHLCRLP